MIARRHFLTLTGGLLLAPLAGCGKQGHWPEGMAEIKWDRDTCARCNMVISDPRFAAELRGDEITIARLLALAAGSVGSSPPSRIAA